ncbi:MAG TPA: NADH-quinone oxidoreductase subunit H [Gemmatimonadales bacterium]|jgi:formate hydrogenlyase subunit 4|nr:NADH-quinone oxidoreductase subunit H [Gemmatimonadales bacterium]
MTSALLSLGLLLLLAPLVPGVATRTRALLTGRRGAPVHQLYADLWKLLRRGAVYSTTTTTMFRLAPIAVAATTVLAVLLLPLDGRAGLLGFSGDVLAFAGLLGLGHFLLVLAALDTGSSLEGMGASREVTFASFVELGFFFAIATLSVVSREVSLAGMIAGPVSRPGPGAAASLVMVAAGLFALLLAECSRVPVDDPATHLELTMIHEVMVLDHSGPDLALLLYAGALKLAALASLIVVLLLSRAAVPLAIWLVILLAGVLAIGMAVGVVEAATARLRLPRVPLYLAGSAALAGFGLLLVLR